MGCETEMAGIGRLRLYLKNYRLRGMGEHIEVWVATGKSQLCDGDPATTEDCPTW